MTSIDGVLVADKPAGPTSHDVVDQVRRYAGGARVGHTGTLDPFATGVLPLCIGRATRLARWLGATRKVYAATMRLGVSTDSYDADGTVTSTRPAGGIDAATVTAAARGLIGDMMQMPPRFSAKKVRGRPMHRLARRGMEVPVKPSFVTVHRLEILEVSGADVRFEVETSPGTYVRSIAHDLGEALGCGAHLTQLRRLSSGSFRIEEAHGLDEILLRGREGTLEPIVLPLNDLDLGLPTVRATAGGAAAMRHGRFLTAGDVLPARGSSAPAPGAGLVRVEDEGGNLIGVAREALAEGGEAILRPEVVLGAP